MQFRKKVTWQFKVIKELLILSNDENDYSTQKKMSLICYKMMTDNEKLLLKHMQLVIVVSLLFMALHFPTVNKIIM